MCVFQKICLSVKRLFKGLVISRLQCPTFHEVWMNLITEKTLEYFQGKPPRECGRSLWGHSWGCLVDHGPPRSDPGGWGGWGEALKWRLTPSPWPLTQRADIDYERRTVRHRDEMKAEEVASCPLPLPKLFNPTIPTSVVSVWHLLSDMTSAHTVHFWSELSIHFNSIHTVFSHISLYVARTWLAEPRCEG